MWTRAIHGVQHFVEHGDMSATDHPIASSVIEGARRHGAGDRPARSDDLTY